MRLYLKLAFMIALTAFLQLRIIDPYKNKLQADVDTWQANAESVALCQQWDLAQAGR
jgi:hypothetical protein